MRIQKLIIVLAVVFALLLGWANYWVLRFNNQSNDDISKVPIQMACLVLGTSPKLSNGTPNAYFTHRMNAAFTTYQAKKCQVFVVSGDNRRKSYNEPDAMKIALIGMGVPAEKIYCDYAGGRTLDSVIRFKTVFGQKRGMVISQQFHNTRAIYLAQANGIELSGYNARDVEAYWGLRTPLREVLSRGLAVLDAQMFQTQPRHGGEIVRLDAPAQAINTSN